MEIKNITYYPDIEHRGNTLQTWVRIFRYGRWYRVLVIENVNDNIEISYTQIIKCVYLTQLLYKPNIDIKTGESINFPNGTPFNPIDYCQLTEEDRIDKRYGLFTTS